MTRQARPFGAITKPGRARLAALRPMVSFTLGCALLALLLFLPATPGDFPFGWVDGIPVELLAAAGLLLLAQGLVFRLLLAVIGLAAAVILFLKLADLGTYSAFGRPFNPLLDVVILTDGWNLLTGTVGLAEAFAIIAAAIAVWALAIAILVYALAQGRKLRGPRAHRIGAVACILALLGGVADYADRPNPEGIPLLSAENSAFATGRIDLIRQSSLDLIAFESDLAADPLADLAGQPILQALGGRDVYILFVESYGRTVLSDPAYRALIEPRLKAVEKQLSEAGYGARSGWLASPTVGGQSWLAHGALLSGLPTTDQHRYDRMIASERQTLNALFRRSGWRTVAVMPAITMDWPEGGYYGYDEIFAAADLGYRGLPFNWVTMPDQYTLSAARRIVESADRPVMVEAALISSHAPWTPIPRLVPWDAVGDGTVFDAQASVGPTPKEVWAEPARVRDHFVRSIDYALQTIGDFIARFGDDAVFIVLGDHQPARLLTGDGAGRDVPFHILANDPAVLERLGPLGLDNGLIPAEDQASRTMWSVRESLVRTLTNAGRSEDGTERTAGSSTARSELIDKGY
ncbi:sulfatase-like hydrolase/transferase [Fulvimarina endophytica]|nr:sulfatase-like hydrolase/transferase [Fulvimarina endophytica]